jgi:hypothetical protein
MDARTEPVLTLPTGGPPRRLENTKAGVMFFTEDPRQAKATEIPVTGPFRSVAPNDLEIPSNLEKDVNSDGTNSTSPLESIKVSKKQTQNGVKTTRKNVLPIGKRAQITRIAKSSAKARMRIALHGHIVYAVPCHYGPLSLKIERTNRECI